MVSAALQPQDLAITILGNELLHHPELTAWSGGMVGLMGRFGFSTASARAALARLVKRDLLQRERRGREMHYRLAPRARHRLAEGEQRILAFGTDSSWDGTWTIVSYSLPERLRSRRDQLRIRMEFLGFGPLRDGTWIAPRNHVEDIAQLLAELDIDEGADLFIGEPAPAGSVEQLVHRVWDLEDLDQRYAAFIATYGPAGLDEPRCDIDALVVRTRLMHAFRQFPSADPELPDELLPHHSRRADAVATFRDRWQTLEPVAHRAFVTHIAATTSGGFPCP